MSENNYTTADGGNLLADSALRDILPVPLITLDRGREVSDLNPAASRLLGLDAEEAIGKTCSEIFHCEECRDECAVSTAREKGRVSLSCPTIVTRDGTRGSLQLLLDALPLSGDRTALVLHPVPEGTPLRQVAGHPEVFHGLVWVSASMKEVVARIIEYARGSRPVLIAGERGTEKELVARALHAESGRAQGPFVAVDGDAEADDLPGAGGATRGLGQRDRFAGARGGTLFVRNVAKLPREVQAALTRQVGAGGPAAEQNARLVAADEGDLAEALQEGAVLPEFHALFGARQILLPALRDRCEDLPVLAQRILARIAARVSAEPASLTGDVTAALLAHNWPGNVHELEQVLRDASSNAEGGIIRRGDLPTEFLPDGWVAKSERARTAEALRKAAGNISLAARMLGVHRITLWRRMRTLGLNRKEFLPR